MTVFGGPGYLANKAVNWTYLDQSLDIVINSGLLPGFEVMGNPGGELFSSFKDDSQVRAWNVFVQVMVQRYLARYGAESVLQWRFESWSVLLFCLVICAYCLHQQLAQTRGLTFFGSLLIGSVMAFSSFSHSCCCCVGSLVVWLEGLVLFSISARAHRNEPEGQCQKQLTVGIECDLPSFLNYFDATLAALHAVDPAIIFGGTASDGNHSFLFAMIEHCLRGTNFITGDAGCGNISFLNAHLKGDADALGILAKELPVAKQVLALTRGTPLATVPWGNDEADPLVGTFSIVVLLNFYLSFTAVLYFCPVQIGAVSKVGERMHGKLFFRFKVK